MKISNCLDALDLIENQWLTTSNKFKFLVYYLVSLLIGILSAYYILGDKLDPTNVDWLLNDNPDLPQHYFGWLFFRNEPDLHWPLTKIDSLLYPTGTNLVFTDSIPILAIVAKQFKNLLPENFQYFGLQIILSCTMQVFFRDTNYCFID